MLTKFTNFAISFLLWILSISSITAPGIPRSSDTSESSGNERRWCPPHQSCLSGMHTYTGHQTNPNDSTHFPPTRNEIDVFSDRGPPFRPLHWPNVLQTLPKPGTLSSIESTQKQLIFLGFHVRSTCMETVTSYAKSLWYYFTLTLYHIFIFFIQMYIYTHVLYVCNDDVIWSQRLISVQVSTPVSWDAISAGSHRLQRVGTKQ